MKEVKVGIVMGSDSDLPVMKQAVTVLDELDIGCEVIIASAHRTPEQVFSYARNAAERGLEVIIAGAGGAAHLPGVIAALTTLPVIGVPMKTETLGGQDSLYSIVQMPSGIPVATMAINGAKNAGIYAAQILALKYPSIKERIVAYRERMAADVQAKGARLKELGVESYLAQKK
ncbi:MAG: 5-(carboxyamino)imidazole ribonucleotide mutase [Clostridia bacterium]|jgi:5-(carboxyamino)imidazole ribonucleotide mutase|nr:5-(carboxyamino)imidazole ribonucleotide mutase [Clostridia bacterium]